MVCNTKNSDFLILNYTKMSEFSPDMNTKMMELMFFSFSFPDKWLIPTFFLSEKRIRFSLQSRNPDSFPFSDSAYNSSPRIVFTATRPCVIVRPTATPTKYSG